MAVEPFIFGFVVLGILAAILVFRGRMIRHDKKLKNQAESLAISYLSEALFWKGSGGNFEYPDDARLLAMPQRDALDELAARYLKKLKEEDDS